MFLSYNINKVFELQHVVIQVITVLFSWRDQGNIGQMTEVKI